MQCNETEAWCRGHLHHPAKKRTGPIYSTRRLHGVTADGTSDKED